MPSNVLNRRIVRQALATLLDAKFDATWDVFDFKTPKFNGKARNIVVSSQGSGREIRGAKSTESDSIFRFFIWVYVLYANAAENWTAEDSENALDAAEKDIADLCNDNQSAANWNHLTIEGVSDPDTVLDEGGQVFRREIITVRTEKYT